MPRKYNKTSPYWNQKQQLKSSIAPVEKRPVKEMPNINYEFGGEAYASVNEAMAAAYEDSFSPTISPVERFKNIAGGILPWEQSNGHMSISSAMILCQKAYANVAAFRNAIEGAVEFSNSALHIKTDNQTVKDWFTEWFSRINIHKLKDNWFRGHYREANNFFYRYMGKIEEGKYAQMKTVFGAKSPYVPIRYVALNPTQVFLSAGLINNSTYVKLLSRYEILKLQQQVTPEDKQVFNSLPDNVKKDILSGRQGQWIYIPLDPKRLIATFYKKQDYEPMAIPMGYPLLNDIEWKMELKKMDMSLSKTIEHSILLVTTGEPATEWGGGGINPQNITNLQNIFRNQTIGRVLVADFSTNAEWKIPDISKILGPEKFQQVEKDLQEGLQSIFFGADDKFANGSMKAKIFTERMKDGQKIFLNEFLIPEIKMICEAMNFRDVPEIEFEQINLDDSSQRERVILRLAEIGILTPDEVFTALETGILPEKETNLINQQEYKKARDKELYMPLIGGPKQDGGDGRPVGTKGPKTVKKPAQKGVTKAGLSMSRIAELSIKADRLLEDIEAVFKKKQKLKNLSQSVKDVALTLAKCIMANEPDKKWLDCIQEYLANPKEINSVSASIIDDTAIEYDINEWQAIIISKSQEQKE